MRISDWSSDVCSSDLAHSAVAASSMDVPANAQQAVAVVDAFGHALAAGDLNTVESLLDAEVLILESGGAERSREQYLGHHAISDARFLKDSQREIAYRKARAARSEEHTSELQSLMRISYAVFCLKKKKNHRQTET